MNTDCRLNITLHSKNVTNITTIYNGQFKRRLYIGYNYKEAEKKFKKALEKGEI